MDIRVLKNIYGANQEKADEIRKRLSGNKVLMLNLIGSPGSGKTTLLEKTAALLMPTLRIAFIEGDVATDRDARRLQKFDRPVTLINTDGACHLEALSIEKSLEYVDLESLDIIFIENVGNLVCPAEFDIGEHAKVAVLSVPEGDDKPAKYPLLFHESKAVILHKTDLMPYTDFRKDAFLNDVHNIQPRLPVFEISSKSETGFEPWIEWVITRLKGL